MMNKNCQLRNGAKNLNWYSRPFPGVVFFYFNRKKV